MSPALRALFSLAQLRIVAALALLILPGQVHAAEPPPIRDDLPSAHPLPAPPSAHTTSPAASDRSFVALVAHGRWATLPDTFLDLPFATHPLDFHTGSLALSLEFGDLDETAWAITFDWTPLFPKAGNWQTRGQLPTDASYVERGGHLLSLDATYRRQLRMGAHARAMIGGGLGVGYFLGDFHAATVLPNCTAPVAACAHWPRTTQRTLKLATRVIPVVHLLAGLEFDLGAGMSLRLEGGFRNLLYAGLALAAQL